MDGVIKVRFPNDLWWTDIPYEVVLKWYDLEVTYLTDNTCFISYNGPMSNTRIKVELYRQDYDKIMDQKAFRLKFNLKKHEIL